MEEENYAVELLVLEFETAAILQDFNEFVPMHRLRYELFIRMNYRALVSRKCCEEVRLKFALLHQYKKLKFNLYCY